jgi:hypothetical protein
MPMYFTIRTEIAPVKQERIRRVLSMAQKRDIVIIEQTSFDLDLDKVGSPRTHPMHPMDAGAEKFWDYGIGFST